MLITDSRLSLSTNTAALLQKQGIHTALLTETGKQNFAMPAVSVNRSSSFSIHSLLLRLKTVDVYPQTITFIFDVNEYISLYCDEKACNYNTAIQELITANVMLVSYFTPHLLSTPGGRFVFVYREGNYADSPPIAAAAGAFKALAEQTLSSDTSGTALLEAGSMLIKIEDMEAAAAAQWLSGKIQQTPRQPLSKPSLRWVRSGHRSLFG